jgi:hypothetical protein
MKYQYLMTSQQTASYKFLKNNVAKKKYIRSWKIPTPYERLAVSTNVAGVKRITNIDIFTAAKKISKERQMVMDIHRNKSVQIKETAVVLAGGVCICRT